jgi:nucleoside-diphosphate-sugar epimerase
VTRQALVTGAGGFIGRRLRSWLEERSVPVTGWTRTDVDLEDRAAVAEALAVLDPGIIFHLAAIPARAEDSDWRLIARETAMLDSLAEALPSNAVLIYCGSMAEIGHSGMHDEHVWCRPRTLYGMAKYAATNRALAMALAGRAVRVARLFGVYGPGEGPQRLIPSLVSQLARSEPAKLSHGRQIRDFVHVDDVCTALWAIASAKEARLPALINIGTGCGVCVADVCRTVAAVLGADPALLNFGAIDQRHVDEAELVARVSRLQQVTGLALPQHAIGPAPMFVNYVAELAAS